MADYASRDVEALESAISRSDSEVIRDQVAATPNTTPPEVSNLSPAPGTPLDPLEPIQFDVTDDEGEFRIVLVSVTLAGSGIDEVAWNGSAFRGLYGTSSTRTAISGGFRFVLLRDGGWPSSPTLRVFAIDTAGNEAA